MLWKTTWWIMNQPPGGWTWMNCLYMYIYIYIYLFIMWLDVLVETAFTCISIKAMLSACDKSAQWKMVLRLCTTGFSHGFVVDEVTYGPVPSWPMLTACQLKLGIKFLYVSIRKGPRILCCPLLCHIASPATADCAAEREGIVLESR